MSDVADEEISIAPGTVLGSYVIVRRLGSGAFGAVYEARKRPLDKRIALKLLLPRHARNRSTYERFLQEAQAAASLKHPHIVDVDDVGEVDRMPYLAMEYLEGETLSVMLAREGMLHATKAIEVLLPVLSAAAVVHGRGIVHRDLKPDNLFLWKPVAGQLNPKILDFGIAKVLEGEAAEVTRTGTLMGTPRYMSPEQWSGSKYATAASDQWSLGVILFECLTGRFPFDANEMPALMTQVATAKPSPMSSFAPKVPAELEEVVLRTLEKEPSQRFEDVKAFARALLPFATPDVRERWASEFRIEATASIALDATLAAQGREAPAVSTQGEHKKSGSPLGHAKPADTVAVVESMVLPGIAAADGESPKNSRVVPSDAADARPARPTLRNAVLALVASVVVASGGAAAMRIWGSTTPLPPRESVGERPTLPPPAEFLGARLEPIAAVTKPMAHAPSVAGDDAAVAPAQDAARSTSAGGRPHHIRHPTEHTTDHTAEVDSVGSNGALIIQP